jgi:hypothetical protein
MIALLIKGTLEHIAAITCIIGQFTNILKFKLVKNTKHVILDIFLFYTTLSNKFSRVFKLEDFDRMK